MEKLQEFLPIDQYDDETEKILKSISEVSLPDDKEREFASLKREMSNIYNSRYCFDVQDYDEESIEENTSDEQENETTTVQPNEEVCGSLEPEFTEIMGDQSLSYEKRLETWKVRSILLIMGKVELNVIVCS